MTANAKLLLDLSSTGAIPENAFGHGEVYFVGTATVFFRYGGFCFMTDPNFLHKGDHAHLGPAVIAVRQTEPAVQLEDLPKDIDFILLSHLHEDHFDRLYMEKGPANITIITTPHGVEQISQHPRFKDASLYSLSTWDQMVVRKGAAQLTITATPGKHAPTGLGFVLPPVMGSLLDFGTQEAPEQFRLWISGDTLVHDDLKEIPKRFPNISLALIHLGGTTVLGLFVVTMDAKQGVECLKIVKPKVAIPIHYNDYDLFKSPLHDFVDLASQDTELQETTRLVYLKHGESYKFDVLKEFAQTAAIPTQTASLEE